MNYVLSKDGQAKLENHPLKLWVKQLFNLDLSTDDMLEGQKLSDLEKGLISEDQYIIGNLFKKVEDDLGLQPREKLLHNTMQDFDRLRGIAQKVRVALGADGTNVKKVLEVAREECAYLFQDFNPWLLKPRFTSGATEELSRSKTTIERASVCNYESIRRLDSIDTDLRPYYAALLGIPHQSNAENDGTWVQFETVPKTAIIDRPIGYHEPFQLAVQCGFADWIVDMLKLRFNIDMIKAQQIHRDLAWWGSFNPGQLCTMDQSNASQNISRTLCRWLIPAPVYQFLDAITPTHIKIEGNKYPLEMMCAQGHGANTAVQTVIFSALIRAVILVSATNQKQNLASWSRKRRDSFLRYKVYQYGDDSIFPAEFFETVKALFTVIGFEVNSNKSFSAHVLESCGMDAIRGTNVRPYYVKKLPYSTVDWIHVANGIRTVGYYNNGCSWRSTFYARLWLRCVYKVPYGDRLFGPRSFGDLVINTENANLYSQPDEYHLRTLSPRIRYTSNIMSLQRSYGGKSKVNILRHLSDPFYKGKGFRHYGPYQERKARLRDNLNSKLDGFGKQSALLGCTETDPDILWSTFNIEQKMQQYRETQESRRQWLLQRLHCLLVRRYEQAIEEHRLSEELVDIQL